MGTNISEPTEARVILDGLRHVVRTLRVSARAVERRHGMSGAQLFVLHQLADGQPRSINDLAAATHTHQSSVSVVVSRLLGAGLARRTSSCGDGRRHEVALTALGKRKLQRAPEPAQAQVIEAIERLTPQNRRALARGLSALGDALGVGVAPPQLFFENEVERAPRR